jgi:TRAP transporter TAXI family solute receptor
MGLAKWEKKHAGLLAGWLGLAAALSTGSVQAQTMGFATLPPGTLNHTTASAISKVMKDKAGINMLVQPVAGDQVIVPMVGRGEADIGITNAPELAVAIKGGKQPSLRLIGSAHVLLTAFFVRKSSEFKTIADLKGKRVTTGYSAMRVIDQITDAILATGGLSQKDIRAVPVPNVVRSADAFTSNAADMFFFAFGAPKVREVDATVGGIRVLEIDEKGMAAARKITAYGYLTPVKPGPIFVGIDKPMKVYTFDNLLFTNTKVSDDKVYKFIDTLVKNKADLVAVQPVLRAFSAENLHKQYDLPYHPGALKYFADNKIPAKATR